MPQRAFREAKVKFTTARPPATIYALRYTMRSNELKKKIDETRKKQSDAAQEEKKAASEMEQVGGGGGLLGL